MEENDNELKELEKSEIIPKIKQSDPNNYNEDF
jgi:hypothetical protein